MAVYSKVIQEIGLPDVFNFLASDSCKLSSYAIRERFAYFTEYALNGLDNPKDRLIMLIYYVINCDDFDLPLHLPIIINNKELLNASIFGVPIIGFASSSNKRLLINMGVSAVEIDLRKQQIVNGIKKAFVSQYNKYNSHKEYLEMFRSYMSNDTRYENDNKFHK